MRKLAMFSFSFALATGLCVYLIPGAGGWIPGGILLLLGIPLWFFSQDAARRIRICLLGGALGFLLGAAFYTFSIAPQEALAGPDQTLTLEVAETPRETDYGFRAECLLPRGGRILTYFGPDARELSLGDRVFFRGRVETVEEKREHPLYYESRDIHLLGYQKGEVSYESPRRLPVRLYPLHIARLVRERLLEIFPEDVEGIPVAIILGDKRGLSYSFLNELSLTGISHVVAVSGMHVSMILTAIMLFLKRRRRLTALLAVPLVWFFAAMVGFTPSVVRAAVMQTVLLGAPVLGRENDGITSLSGALLVILLVNPRAAASLSLQLSFGAVLGMLLFANPIRRWLLGPLGRKRHTGKKKGHGRTLFGSLRRSLASMVAATLSAQIFTLPLSALYFGQVSVLSPLTNILLLPIVSLCFLLSIAAVILGFLYLPAGIFLGGLIAWPLRLIQSATGLLARIPNCAVYTASPYITAWICVLYLLLLVFLLHSRRNPHLLLLSGTVTLVCALLFSAADGRISSFTLLDVGQGQCALFHTKSVTALIDCGGSRGDADGEEAARTLLARGIRRADLVILTHYDRDHISGLEQFLRRIPTDRIVGPDIPGTEEKQQEVRELAKDFGGEFSILREDMEEVFPEGTIHVLAPVETGAKNDGLTALLSLGKYDILITGDMDSSGERALLRNYCFPDVEVLVAGHHGAESSTCQELLTAVRPELVLFSVGRNDYGHPSPEVLARVSQRGAAIRRTDLEGDIVIMR